MNKFVLIFLLLFFNYSFSQKHLRADSKANKINITDWVLNTPKDKNLNGKYVVLNFWSTAENNQNGYDYISQFNTLKEKYNQDNLYFITMTNEKVIDLKKYFKNLNFKGIVVSDQKKMTQTLYGNKDGSIEIPITILINKEGIIKWIGYTYYINEQVIKDFIADKLVPYSMYVKPKS